MKSFPLNVWLLLIAGALGLCIAPMIVFIGGIIGSELAPLESLSTLPVASLVIGTALAVVPAARIAEVFGRKKVFFGGAVWAAVMSLLCALAVTIESFLLFVVACTGLGAALAVIQQYRFAAMESVASADAPKAASFIMLGGLFAALLGPELVDLGVIIFAEKFVGAFFLLAVVVMSGGMVLLFYIPVQCVEDNLLEGGRELKEIVRNRVLWVAIMASTVGYAVMSYIMTATPVSMHVMDGHALGETKWVIQSHILAMFAPSLFSGFLIARFGVYRMMLAGLFAYTFCLAVALSGQAVMHYWYSLVLLGIGWNFLFVSGTVLLPQTYRPEERYRVQGLNDLFVFIFQALASILSGAVIYAVGWNAMLVYTVPLLLVQLMMIVIWKRKRDES